VFPPVAPTIVQYYITVQTIHVDDISFFDMHSLPARSAGWLSTTPKTARVTLPRPRSSSNDRQARRNRGRQRADTALPACGPSHTLCPANRRAHL